MDNAEMYIAANPMQKKDAQDIMNELKDTFVWSKHENVLDVGSGPGDVTVNILQKIAPKDTTIIGSDISKKMVDYGNSQYKSVIFKILDIQGKNIWQEWKKESFNKIFSFYCFHWVIDQRQAVQNMYSLLKSGGELFLLFMSTNPVFKLYLTLSRTIEWGSYMTDVDKFISPYHLSEKPADQFAQVLREAHFSGIKVFTKNTSFVYPSRESMINSIRAVNPFLERIPYELRDDYNSCISNTIEQLNLAEKQEDGSYKVKYTLIVARAKKN